MRIEHSVSPEGHGSRLVSKYEVGWDKKPPVSRMFAAMPERKTHWAKGTSNTKKNTGELLDLPHLVALPILSRSTGKI